MKFLFTMLCFYSLIWETHQRWLYTYFASSTFLKRPSLSISPLWHHRCPIYSNPKSVIKPEAGVCSASWISDYSKCSQSSIIYYKVHLFWIEVVQTSWLTLFLQSDQDWSRAASGSSLHWMKPLIIRRRRCEGGQLSLWHLGLVLALLGCFFWGHTRLKRASTPSLSLLRLSRSFPQSNSSSASSPPRSVEDDLAIIKVFLGHTAWRARWRCHFSLPATQPEPQRRGLSRHG